jgi:hypothetical protein
MLIEQHLTKRLGRHRNVGVLWSKLGLPDRNGSIVETARLCEITQERVQNRQIMDSGCDIQVIATKSVLFDFQCPLVRNPGRGVVAQVLVRYCQVIQVPGSLEMSGTETSLSDRQRTLTKGFRFRQLAKVIDGRCQVPKAERNVWVIAS